MGWNQLKGNWSQMRESAKQKWYKASRDDRAEQEGRELRDNLETTEKKERGESRESNGAE